MTDTFGGICVCIGLKQCFAHFNAVAQKCFRRILAMLEEAFDGSWRRRVKHVIKIAKRVVNGHQDALKETFPMPTGQAAV